MIPQQLDSIRRWRTRWFDLLQQTDSTPNFRQRVSGRGRGWWCGVILGFLLRMELGGNLFRVVARRRWRVPRRNQVRCRHCRLHWYVWQIWVVFRRTGLCRSLLVAMVNLWWPLIAIWFEVIVEHSSLHSNHNYIVAGSNILKFSLQRNPAILALEHLWRTCKLSGTEFNCLTNTRQLQSKRQKYHQIKKKTKTKTHIHTHKYIHTPFDSNAMI